MYCKAVRKAGRSRAVAATTILLLCTSSVSAQTFKGQFYSDLYVWSTDSTDHIEPYFGLRSRLQLTPPDQRVTVGFQSNVRWRDDFGDKVEGQSDFFVYDAYLEATFPWRRLNARAGRQFVYTTAGSALIDGGRLRLQPISRLRLDLFGGSEVRRLEPDKVQSFSDHLIAGGRLSGIPARDFQVAVNWMLRQTDGDVVSNRLNFDGSYSPRRWRVYGRVGMNMQTMDLAEVIGRASLSYRKWYFSGEYLQREPSVRNNSIFALIDFKPYKLVRSEVRRRVWRSFDLFSRGDFTLYDDDNVISSSIGIGNGLFSIAWVHQSGRYGDNDGVDGFASMTIAEVWSAYGHARLTRYQVQEEVDEKSDAYSAAIGVSRSLGRDFRGRGEIQYLRNAVSESDVRLYLRLSKDFSIGGEKK